MIMYKKNKGENVFSQLNPSYSAFHLVILQRIFVTFLLEKSKKYLSNSTKLRDPYMKYYEGDIGEYPIS